MAKKNRTVIQSIKAIFQPKIGTRQSMIFADPRIKADTENIRALPTSAQGKSGTDIQSGQFVDEYLSTLKGRDAIIEFDKMRRQDDGVIRVIRMITNPIKSANWYIESGKTGDKKMDEIADAVTFDVFDDMSKPWSQNLNDIITFLPFGFSLFEPTKKVSTTKKYGTRWNIKDLGFRAQKTITEWDIKDGKIIKVHQEYTGDDPVDVWLDGKRIIVFTNDREGDEFDGISILRAIYGNYLRKQTYLTILYNGMRKNADGIPVVTVPAGRESSKELDTAELFLQSYTDGERPYLIVPEGFEFDIKDAKFDAKKVQDIIDGENVGMIKSILAQFLELGQSGAGGSYSLGTDQSDIFLDTLVQYGNYICDMFNKHIIKPLVIENYGEQEYYPELKVSGIKDKASKEFAEILKFLSDAGLLSQDATLIQWAREFYNLPEADETEILQTLKQKNAPTIVQNPFNPQQPAQAQPQPPADNKDKGTAQPQGADKPNQQDVQDTKDDQAKKGKQMSLAEAIDGLTVYANKVDLQEVNQAFEQFEAQYNTVVRNRLNLMAEKYMADIRNAMKHGKSVKKIDVGMLRDFAEAVGKQIEKMETEGFQQVESELGIINGEGE